MINITQSKQDSNHNITINHFKGSIFNRFLETPGDDQNFSPEKVEFKEPDIRTKFLLRNHWRTCRTSAIRIVMRRSLIYLGNRSTGEDQNGSPSGLRSAAHQRAQPRRRVHLRTHSAAGAPRSRAHAPVRTASDFKCGSLREIQGRLRVRRGGVGSGRPRPLLSPLLNVHRSIITFLLIHY